VREDVGFELQSVGIATNEEKTLLVVHYKKRGLLLVNALVGELRFSGSIHGRALSDRLLPGCGGRGGGRSDSRKSGCGSRNCSVHGRDHGENKKLDLGGEHLLSGVLQALVLEG